MSNIAENYSQGYPEQDFLQILGNLSHININNYLYNKKGVENYVYGLDDQVTTYLTVKDDKYYKKPYIIRSQNFYHKKCSKIFHSKSISTIAKFYNNYKEGQLAIELVKHRGKWGKNDKYLIINHEAAGSTLEKPELLGTLEVDSGWCCSSKLHIYDKDGVHFYTINKSVAKKFWWHNNNSVYHIEQVDKEDYDFRMTTKGDAWDYNVDMLVNFPFDTSVNLKVLLTMAGYLI